MKIYIVCNTLYCVYNNKLLSSVFKSINKGYITNKNIFIEEFTKFMKRKKIKNKLFGEPITIVNNGYFNNADLYFLENIFIELGFTKVIYLDIRLFLPQEQATYVELNDSYIVLYLDDTIYLDLKYFSSLTNLFNCLDKFIKKNVIFFGINKSIPTIEKYIKNKTFFYIDDYANYIPKCLL